MATFRWEGGAPLGWNMWKTSEAGSKMFSSRMGGGHKGVLHVNH